MCDSLNLGFISYLYIRFEFNVLYISHFLGMHIFSENVALFNNLANNSYIFLLFILGSLLVEDWAASKSTLERVWSAHFPDVRIPVTNRFSKCQDCERLKKMIHSGDVEAGHNLSPEQLSKLADDKVGYKITLMSNIFDRATCLFINCHLLVTCFLFGR